MKFLIKPLVNQNVTVNYLQTIWLKSLIGYVACLCMRPDWVKIVCIRERCKNMINNLIDSGPYASGAYEIELVILSIIELLQSIPKIDNK